MTGVESFGDSAVLVDVPSADPVELVSALSDLDGVEEVLPGAVICVRFAPGRVRDLETTIAELVSAFEEEGRGREEERAGRDAFARPRQVELPVVFDGPDLEAVSRLTGSSTRQVIESIIGARLRVAYLGFAPGFAYVTGLPGPLATLERRATPRTSVPAGSVGIAGGYLGIYPQASPGGWNLVGRTDAQLFDPGAPPYSTLQPGDILTLVESEELGPAHAASTIRARPRTQSRRRVEVIEPGVLTTLQDAGRIGVAHLGVPRAGPVDRDSMRLANLTAGNPENCGVLETTVRGPTLRISDDAHAVVVGAAWEVNGRAMVPGVVAEIPSQGVLTIGASIELRGYVAVSGGFRGPELFGSCSSDLLCGLGPGPLAVGDELDIGEPGQPRGYTAPLSRSRNVVRVTPGPGPVDDELLSHLAEVAFSVSPDSNRIGVRLVGSRPFRSAPNSGPVDGAPARGSHGMVPGAVQIPPSGEPIVLLCDHATMGGYPVVAVVVSADLGVIAQRRPGDLVKFELVDLDQALAALDALDRQLTNAPTGIYPAGPVTWR